VRVCMCMYAVVVSASTCECACVDESVFASYWYDRILYKHLHADNVLPVGTYVWFQTFIA